MKETLRRGHMKETHEGEQIPSNDLKKPYHFYKQSD